MNLNSTHDAEVGAWLATANSPSTDFPLQNLPLGMFVRPGSDVVTPGVAIGNMVLDLSLALKAGLLDGESAQAVQLMLSGRLNGLMAAPPSLAHALRGAVFELLRLGSAHQEAVIACLVAQDAVSMVLAVDVGDFSDFSVSRAHNATMGKVSRRTSPLHPNFDHLPIAYHGRCSSLVVSGTACRRPMGQRGARTDAQPTHGPSARLDYEMELGCYIGRPSTLGSSVALSDAESHLFGFSLLNDWSARDIQSWELTPLGPFQGKSFLTSLSPWVVTVEALAPYRRACVPWPSDLPAQFPYFVDPHVASYGAFDITVQAALRTQRMRDEGRAAITLSTGQLADHPWSVFQLIAHQTHNGCNLRTGDLIGTGTISGDGPGEQGCLQELSQGGQVPFDLPGGERRTYLEDGDEVTFTASCHRDGFARIGFGLCHGMVIPASNPIFTGDKS